jgi:hypothetical protein
MAGKNVLNLGSCLSQKELGLLAIIGVNKGPLTGNFCEAARGGRVLFLGCEFAIDALCELKAKTEANKSFNRYSGEIHDLIEKLRTAHGGGRGVSGTICPRAAQPLMKYRARLTSAVSDAPHAATTAAPAPSHARAGEEADADGVTAGH